MLVKLGGGTIHAAAVKWPVNHKGSDESSDLGSGAPAQPHAGACSAMAEVKPLALTLPSGCEARDRIEAAERIGLTADLAPRRAGCCRGESGQLRSNSLDSGRIRADLRRHPASL